MSSNHLLDLIKYPIITDKATKLLELNQYTFATAKNASKTQIKVAIEQLFNVKVKSVNTHRVPQKQRRIGKFIGKKANYKRAILTLAPNNSINLFSEN
jgi:large subunit ribosomal protein L23